MEEVLESETEEIEMDVLPTTKYDVLLGIAAADRWFSRSWSNIH